MIFWIGRGFAEVQILKKVKLNSFTNRLDHFDKILQTIRRWKDLAQVSAKWHLSSVEVLPSAKFWKKKKGKWPYVLKWVEYFDKLLRNHWYWQDLAQEIANWHFLSVEALSSSKFWKSENGPISWAESRFCRGSNSEKKWNWPYLLNLLVYFDTTLHTHYYWHDLDRGIAKSSPRDCKRTFNIGRGCTSSEFWKSENGRTEWTIVMKLCIHIDIDKM